jgi:RNA ligase (TIGR02306 family)
VAEPRKSTHRVEIVRIGTIEKHPNADALGVVRVYGYACCVRLADWRPGDLAAYVVPDSLVPLDRKEFAFLADASKGKAHHRVKVRTMRGVVSQGLLVRAPEGAKEGDDVADLLQVVRYVPPEPVSTGGPAEQPPEERPSYDVESFQRYADAFDDGEEVVVTEKVHGTSARYSCQAGRIWCGTRTDWRVEVPGSVWWRALRQHPEIEGMLARNPAWTLYGEVYGSVQDLKYGVQKGEIRLAGFDLFDAEKGAWMPADAARDVAGRHGIPWVPLLFRGPLDKRTVLAFAEGPSLVGPNVREGCVVLPVRERRHPEIGRVQLKIVGNGYLERA